MCIAITRHELKLLGDQSFDQDVGMVFCRDWQEKGPRQPWTDTAAYGFFDDDRWMTESDLAVEKEQLYNGQGFDPGVGLEFYRVRGICATEGRFIDREPIG